MHGLASHGTRGCSSTGQDSHAVVARLHPDAVLLHVRLREHYDGRESPVELQHELHKVHALVDALVDSSLWKFSCCGGNFLLAAGIANDELDGPADCGVLESLATTLMARIDPKHEPRMALHSGPVSSGIIGTKSLQFGLYGPTVDTVRAVSALCKPGCLVVTNAVWPRLHSRHGFHALDAAAPVPTVKLYAMTLLAGQPTPLQAPLRRWDLRYCSEVLEASYAMHASRRSVAMDVTLLCVVIASQLSWIYRWQFHGSFLFPVMTCLMSFNMLYMMVVLQTRHVYLRWREWMVIASHLVHKVAQLLVTTAPVHGTVHNASYSATVALVESSGFAAILMLSFGLRMRFCRQITAGAVVLGLSMLSNDAVCGAAFPGVPMCSLALAAAQVVGCYVAPCLLVYFMERASRRGFEVAYVGSQQK